LNTAHYDQSIKKIDYLYDLASGKVNKVIYQGDKAEQFIHKYEYDADNKLKIVIKLKVNSGGILEKKAIGVKELVR
jgi:hypothetical protein